MGGCCKFGVGIGSPLGHVVCVGSSSGRPCGDNALALRRGERHLRQGCARTSVLPGIAHLTRQRGLGRVRRQHGRLPALARSPRRGG